MKGKEALKLAQDTILAHNSNNKSSFTMKMLYQVEAELNEKEQELTKYMRAFEILKYEFQLNYEEDEYFCNKKYFLLSDTNIQLEKEQYELLEELMKSEKGN